MRPTPSGVRGPEREVCSYNEQVLSGRLWLAWRTLTSQEGGGVLTTNMECTKTGCPVLEVLCKKHPDLREPPLVGQTNGAFEPYESAPQSVPVDITAELIEEVAPKLSGAAGPGGTDSVTLRNWLLRYGAASKQLRLELASLGSWIVSSNPSWAAYTRNEITPYRTLITPYWTTNMGKNVQYGNCP
jgi:hypothetical protein